MTGGYRATETIKLTIELISIPEPLRNDRNVVRSIILTKRFGIFYQELRSERATGDEATICKLAFLLLSVEDSQHLGGSACSAPRDHRGNGN